MAHTEAHIVIDPSDGAHITLADNGAIGGVVRLKFMRGDTQIGSLSFHTGQGGRADVSQAVAWFVDWLNMVAGETKTALVDWTDGVGEHQEPF